MTPLPLLGDILRPEDARVNQPVVFWLFLRLTILRFLSTIPASNEAQGRADVPLRFFRWSKQERNVILMLYSPANTIWVLLGAALVILAVVYIILLSREGTEEHE